jgi:phospholipid transport system substrate-binding protein
VIRLPRRKAAALVAAAVLTLALLPGRAALALEPEAAKSFVAGAVDDAMATFAGKSLSREDRGARLRDTITRYADPGVTAADVLGRHWDKASADERQRFKATLVDYVVATWSGSLSDIDPAVRITVSGADAKGDRVVVHTVATQPNEPPSNVDWLIASDATGRTIAIDVNVGGVSLTDTMKADFTAVLRANSGQMEALLAAMAKKIAAQPK